MINDILISYFQEKDFVLIPRKGVFIKSKDNNSGQEQVVFIYNPTIDYSDMVAYTQNALDIDENGANTIIEGFCALMDSQLKSKGEYHIDGIGTLCTDHKWGVYTKQNQVAPQARQTKIETGQPATPSKRLEDIISEQSSPEKKLDTILAEPHQRKIEVPTPVTFADKYLKNSELPIEPQDELPVELFTSDIKEVDQKRDEERHDKLNEIFASKRISDSSNELSDKLNELYKTKRDTTTIPTTAPTGTPISTPSSTTVTDDEKTSEHIAPNNKKIDKTMVFFIISIILFLCALCYYFIVRNDVDLALPGGEDAIQTEQTEIIE